MAAVVATLAIGIGANTAIFSVLHAVLLRPLPFADPDSLVHLFNADSEHAEEPLLLQDFEAWKSRARSFEALAVFYKNTGFSRVTLTMGNESESVQGAFVSASFFPLMGVPPRLGRTFNEIEVSRAEPVLILSDGLWKRHFGASLAVIGSTAEIDGRSFHVVGVMPAAFRFPARNSQFWAPITTNRYWAERPISDALHGRGFFARWNAVGRLRPDVPLEQAQAEMTVIAERLESNQPTFNQGFRVRVAPLGVELSDNSQLALSILFGAVALIFLIACANVTSLTLTRIASRQRELSIRAALGASSSRLMGSVLSETALVAGVASFLGVVIASFGVRLLIALGPPDLPRLTEAGIDGTVLSYALVVSILATVLSGVIPAWGRTREAAIASLKSVGRGAAGSPALSRMRGLLVAAEFAVSVVLLTGAGLLIRSFLALEAVDPGFQPERVVTMQVSLPAEAQHAGFYDQALARIQALPGVDAAGSINGQFDLGAPELFGLRAVEGRTIEGQRQWTAPLAWQSVGGSYFEAVGVRLIRGRLFSDQDSPTSPLVAVVDESMSRRYWPGEDPIGKRFKGWDQRGANDDWLTVIGVIGDMRRHGLEREPTAHIYEWSKQSGNATRDIVVRTRVDHANMAGALRSAVSGVNRLAIVSGVTTLEQQLSDQMTPRRFQTWLLTLFAIVGMILASVGVYGVMHHAVAQRTQEIRIRMALGARASTVLAMVLCQGLRLTLVGLTIGMFGSWWLTQLLSGLLYEVKPTDPFTFSAAFLLLVAVAIAASLVPASRAARINPVVALQDE